MSEQTKVYVLAVMDLAASWLPYDGEDDNVSGAFDEARAAVAELIGAAKRLGLAFQAIGNHPGPVSNTSLHVEAEHALIALHAALANVGGA